MQQADETTYIWKVGRWMYGLIFVFLFILGLGMWWRIRENNDN
jgi:hypothetical protein